MKHFAIYSRLALVAVVFTLLTPLAIAQAATWNIDPAHSGVEFSIHHMGISNVHGHFGKVAGVINLNSADITKSSVNATIDVAGVDTGNDGRDNDLKSASFFDVANFATATFASTGVQKNGAGIKVSGNLTLHGVTKPVVLTIDSLAAPITSPMDKKQHVGFEATTTISRADFGIATKFPEAILSDAVKLTIDVEAAQQ